MRSVSTWRFYEADEDPQGRRDAREPRGSPAAGDEENEGAEAEEQASRGGAGPLPAECLTVRIVEEASPEYGLHVWPCARVLAHYVWQHRHQMRGTRVLEVGAGVGLPGITAALLGAQVTLADMHGQHAIFANLQRSMELNGVSCELAEISWGRLDMIPDAGFDLFLGSDILYDSREFDSVLATVRGLLECCCCAPKGGRLILTYQQRSTHASLEYLFAKWGLTCLRVTDGHSIVPDTLESSVLLAEFALDV